MLSFVLTQMQNFPDKDCIVTARHQASYQQILDRYADTCRWLHQQAIPQGAVVSFTGDYSPASISLLLALIQNHNIVVHLSSDSKNHFLEYREIAGTEYDISINDETLELTHTGRQATHRLYEILKKESAPGLVLFSSGSTGKSKAIVQNLDKLISKFQVARKSLRMLIFLQLDHIGGINSLFYSLTNHGTLIIPEDRKPGTVCQAVEQHKAELLPTSPTFLNLLILSKAYQTHDLSSLGLITYGTEPMQDSTLKRLAEIIPDATLQQTYGLSEVGILRSKSRSSDSIWLKVGGEDFITKIVNGTLWIKSDSAMLGYLNAPNPFDEEGFLDTGDMVEQDGEWIKFLGRKSEIINVGGYKVFPAEVESSLLEMDNIEDVVIYGETHPITGQIVVAKIKLNHEQSLKELKVSIRQHCKTRLQSYKIPSKVLLTKEETYNERFKRMRRKDRNIL